MYKIIILAMFGFIANYNFACGQTNEIPKGYAVVVGAYSLNNTEHALKFTNHLTSLGYEGRFGLNESKSLILVYVAHTESFKEAISKMKELREKENFSEAWVHVKTSESRLELTPEQQEKAEMATEAMEKEGVKSIGDISADTFKEKKPDNAENKNLVISPSINEIGKENIKEEIKSENVIVEEIKVEEVQPVKDNRLSVFFNVVNATNGNTINGELQVIDTERSKLIDVLESGEYIKLTDPENGTGQITVIADVFGFRKLQKEFNYYDPYSGDTNAEIDSSEFGPVINFELIKYRKGDIITMYNVFFYKDAAAMLPESKYEVSSLLNMMKENSDLKIKIHGHVNGNNHGKIISVNENNFYSLPTENSNRFGSSKELSKQRAETIRNCLIQDGISPDRMEIKAWGGKRMLHDKNSTKAKQNVRVEVEILED
jgi:outer membrane protein OmpA-like peptidoglycan-associated protein